MNTRRWLAVALMLVVLAVSGFSSHARASGPTPPDGLLLELPMSGALQTATAPVAITPLADAAAAFAHQDAFLFNPLPAQRAFPSGERVEIQQSGEVCVQLIQNHQLDILELGDGTGRAEPWVVLDQIVYYSSQIYYSPQHSLVLVDADANDPSPTVDAFAQAFWAPSELTEVRISYRVAMSDTNADDSALGNVFTVDDEGYLDQFIFGWEVVQTPSQRTWYLHNLTMTDTQVLEALDSQHLALLMFNRTDGEAPGEIVFFDDVTFTACYVPSARRVYLPVVLRNYIPETSGPMCRPPTENPKDTWNANRGRTETHAICNSTLSSTDQEDYYEFTPSASGDHTLHLRNLPSDTEWSAMIFVDTASYPPPYADRKGGGLCYITTPGSGDKNVVCTLTGGTAYFIKVSAGGNYSGPLASYEMAVEGPTGEVTPTPSGIHGNVTYQGNPISGIAVELRYYNGSAWSTRATVNTDANGQYEFTSAPSLSSGQRYYVRYANPNAGTATSNGRLWGWYTAHLTSYTSGTSVAAGNFDIQDVTMQSPANGASVTLPTTFRWNKRTTTSDHYRIFFYDPVDNRGALTQDYGYVGETTIHNLPPGWPSGRTYLWWIRVCQDAECNAYGEAFYSFEARISFSAAASVDMNTEWIVIPESALLLNGIRSLQ